MNFKKLKSTFSKEKKIIWVNTTKNLIYVGTEHYVIEFPQIFKKELFSVLGVGGCEIDCFRIDVKNGDVEKIAPFQTVIDLFQKDINLSPTEKTDILINTPHLKNVQIFSAEKDLITFQEIYIDMAFHFLQKDYKCFINKKNKYLYVKTQDICIMILPIRLSEIKKSVSKYFSTEYRFVPE